MQKQVDTLVNQRLKLDLTHKPAKKDAWVFI